MNRFRLLLTLSVLVFGFHTAYAMDRWAALSMLETGNDDNAVGSNGEVSRFQIRPQLWPGGNPQDGQFALSVAQDIMQARVTAFQKSHNRPPTDFEFYVLWNAPVQADHPSKVVIDRAQRFENLVRRSDLARH